MFELAAGDRRVFDVLSMVNLARSSIVRTGAVARRRTGHLGERNTDIRPIRTPVVDIDLLDSEVGPHK